MNPLNPQAFAGLATMIVFAFLVAGTIVGSVVTLLVRREPPTVQSLLTTAIGAS